MTKIQSNESKNALNEQLKKETNRSSHLYPKQPKYIHTLIHYSICMRLKTLKKKFLPIGTHARVNIVGYIYAHLRVLKVGYMCEGV